MICSHRRTVQPPGSPEGLPGRAKGPGLALRWRSAQMAAGSFGHSRYGCDLHSDPRVQTLWRYPAALAHRRKPPLRSNVRKNPARCCPGGQPPSLSVPGSAGTLRGAHTSPGPLFRCAGFGSCSANRCGASALRPPLGRPALAGRPVLNPRAGARGFAARLCCPAAVLLPPSALGPWPSPAPLVRRSALWSVAPPGGFRLALGGWSFRPPASLCFSGCLPRSVSAPTPPALRPAAAAPPLWLLQS